MRKVVRIFVLSLLSITLLNNPWGAIADDTDDGQVDSRTEYQKIFLSKLVGHTWELIPKYNPPLGMYLDRVNIDSDNIGWINISIPENVFEQIQNIARISEGQHKPARVVDALVQTTYKLLIDNIKVTREESWLATLHTFNEKNTEVDQLDLGQILARILLTRMLTAPPFKFRNEKRKNLKIPITSNLHSLLNTIHPEDGKDKFFRNILSEMISFGIELYKSDSLTLSQNLSRLDPTTDVPPLLKEILLNRALASISAITQYLKVAEPVKNSIQYIQNKTHVRSTVLVDVLINNVLDLLAKSNSEANLIRHTITSRLNQNLGHEGTHSVNVNRHLVDTSIINETLNIKVGHKFTRARIQLELIIYGLDLLANDAPDQLPELKNLLANVHCE